MANGNYFKYRKFAVMKTDRVENIYCDWSFQGKFQSTGMVFTPNSDFASNGSSQFLTNSYKPSTDGLQDDFYYGVKLKSKSTADGTLANLFGVFDGTVNLRMAQDVANCFYYANNATAQTWADAGFIADKYYAVARNSGTQYAFKDATAVSTVALASTGNTDDYSAIGAYWNNTVTANRIAAKYELEFAFEYTSFDYSGFQTHFTTLLTGW